MPTDIEHIYRTCHQEIGGDSHPEVSWYLHDRPAHISRDSFFRAYVRAVWVSGIRAKAVDTFLNSAGSNGFCWRFHQLASWSNGEWGRFIRVLHGRPCPTRARQKWSAVRGTAAELVGYQSEQEFRDDFFAGKSTSKDLDKEDVASLVRRGLPFVRRVNAHYIIRNMGGEAIKCDRWIQAFLQHYGMSLSQLETQVVALGIPLGLFDMVLWSYCSEVVGQVDFFTAHFRRTFGK